MSMRYYSFYNDFNGSNLIWAVNAASKLQRNEWVVTTPLLFDGSHWNDSIREGAVVCLLRALRTSNTAKSVIIRNSSLGLNGEQALSEAFHRNSSVKSLSIQNLVEQSTAFPVSLPASIFKNYSLKEITVEGCFLGQTACLEFATLLQSSKCKLRSLVFKSVTLDESSLGQLCSAIAANTSLRYVTLRDMKQISGVGVRLVLSAFAQNTCIHSLELEEMDLTEQHASDIALFLSINSHLETLSLKKNRLNAKAIQIIMTEGLVENKDLRTLYLSENHIGDDGAMHIVAGMQQNRTLQDLCLKSCGFQHYGCKIIANGLALFPGLKFINMSMNYSEYFTQDILNSLHKNHVIESIGRPYCCMETETATTWDHVDYYLRLNRMDRKRLKELDSLPASQAIHFLAQPKISQQPDVMFYFLRNMTNLYNC